MCVYRPLSELRWITHSDSHCHVKLSICTHTVTFIRTANSQLRACHLVNKFSLKSSRIFEVRVICLLFATWPSLHSNLTVSWLPTAAVKSCFSPTTLKLRVPDISRCSRKLRIWKPQSSMIHSQTTVCEYETLSVILNPHMTIFLIDLQSVEAPLFFQYYITTQAIN